MARPPLRHAAAAALLVAALVLPGCSDSSSGSTGPPSVRVSRDAIARIGIRTARVTTAKRAHHARERAVPYAAVIYDPRGVPSVYTSPAPRTYVRHPVRVDQVAGNTAFLTKGPVAGTPVVVV